MPSTADERAGRDPCARLRTGRAEGAGAERLFTSSAMSGRPRSHGSNSSGQSSLDADSQPLTPGCTSHHRAKEILKAARSSWLTKHEVLDLLTRQEEWGLPVSRGAPDRPPSEVLCRTHPCRYACACA